ncbi:A-kinase anchor protein 12b isoform X2 [Seriola aureovittata]|uniref:A-kinase anchor protein 12b isoform X2 n=1 Tax=Seriola aureovittata TaxID=2871759 RepID=UPI0024BE950C|nr:A-kinase anchor protein 12b isoform X2 [Seriola aureovittata]
MLGTITLTVGQPDGVSVAQKDEAPETMGTIQDEVAPQVNGEKVEKESPDANDISAVEEKAAEEKPDDANEVGFKKIFRFVGFKFTLKKDKSEEKEPVKLLTVKDKEGEEVSGTEEPTKKEEAAEEKNTAEEKEADTEAAAAETEVTKDDTDKAEATDAPDEGTAAEATDEAVKEEGAEKEEEATPPSQETTLSPFRKLFSGGLFSNLRKKASIKKTKEEEDKEAAVEEETAKTEETPAAVDEKEEKTEAEQETKEEAPATPEEEKSEPKEEAPVAPEEEKSETTPEPNATVETPAPAAATTDETKQEEEKAEGGAEEEKAPAEVTSEAELLSSQEKAKPQGSPLKKLFTGAGLKKLSTKKQKNKKDAESKLTESGEQAAKQLQSSTELTEAPKADSGPSSPEESGEHVIAVEVTQNGSSQETEGEVASDGEKKKEGIIAWSSFKKLVTPKKIVKRSSESEDEATGEKPAKPLPSSESAALADKSVEEDAEEEKPTEEEPKTENTEKLVSSTEEPKRKMDTSVSWEALMCMGGPKKKTRRTSDSDDDDETKIEEEAAAAAAASAAVEGEQESKTEAPIVTSQNTESEGEVVSSPEPLNSPPERESTWDTLKRMVMSKNKAKAEEKPEESAEQVQSDSEAPKDESSFSLRKFFPGRRKKKAEKQASTEMGSGEEDSDTPAVVPMSEYDEQVEAEQEAPAEPAAVQIKVSTEDRSPSWIPATVEDIDDKNDQLSDIPEEAENAATPRSVDTDIAEDETEDQATLPPKAPGRMGRRLSTAEEKPVTLALAAKTTPVPQGPKSGTAQEVVGAIEAQISEIPAQTSVTVEDVQVEVATENTEYEPPTETAEAKENTILVPHAQDEAMAICTGLGTKEIAKVTLEKPVVPLVECVAVVRDSLSTEVAIDEKPASTEKATLAADEVIMAQAQEVETIDLEPVVENSQSEATDIQAATESYEPELEKVGVINTVLEETEVIQATSVSENSPKSVVVNPITPTSEIAVCTQSIEVSEPIVETKEVKMDTEQLAATEENSPIKEVAQVTTEEMSSTIGETAKITITKETEPVIPVVIPSEEAPVITETVVIVSSLSTESDQVAISDEVVVKDPAASEAVCDKPVQVEEAKEEGTVVETVEATMVQTAESEISVVPEQATEKTEDIKEDVYPAREIEAQSMVIAQAVIQDAMEKVSEDKPEPKKPASPTATTPTPVQAIATTEEEIEITSVAPVITETPVAVICEKPAPKSPQPLHVAMEVTDTIQIEVIESTDAYVGEEEKKPEEELRQAVEVKVSEEIVVVEEVVEIKAESEELEQVKEEQSKEEEAVQEPDVKEAAEEVKPQSEETTPEAPSEGEKVLAIHMPVQVVLQTAEVVEESVAEEAAEEFDSNGPVTEDTSVKAESPASASKLSTLSEEAPATASGEVSDPSQVTEAAASQPETETEKPPSGKCAEVMAQVIEVIEEAVKEIEPVSTEITAAS